MLLAHIPIVSSAPSRRIRKRRRARGVLHTLRWDTFAHGQTEPRASCFYSLWKEYYNRPSSGTRCHLTVSWQQWDSPLVCLHQLGLLKRARPSSVELPCHDRENHEPKPNPTSQSPLHLHWFIHSCSISNRPRHEESRKLHDRVPLRTCFPSACQRRVPGKNL